MVYEQQTVLSVIWQFKHGLKADGIVKYVCLDVMRRNCSPVLCGRDVVGSLVNDVETSATPSSASLSFLPGSSGRHMQFNLRVISMQSGIQFKAHNNVAPRDLRTTA